MAIISKNSAWPLGIAAFYGAFVILLIVFLIFSTFNTIDLVTEDYYAKELNYQQQINRVKRTEQFGFELTWAYDKNYDAIIIQFPKNLDYADIKGRIHLFRASNSKLDKLISVRLSGSGIQIIPRKLLVYGNWKLKIFWQNKDGKFYSEGTLTLPFRGNE